MLLDQNKPAQSSAIMKCVATIYNFHSDNLQTTHITKEPQKHFFPQDDAEPLALILGLVNRID